MTETLKTMILHYRDNGERVDEVLFQEVMKVILQYDISTIICREYDLLQIENNRLRGLYTKACKAFYDLKITASIKGLFDSVELSNDAKELNLELLKKNAENMRLREALQRIVNIDGVFVGWNEEFNPKTAYQLVDDVARQALECVQNDKTHKT